ncbi:MAG: hypothetical protein ACKVVP_06590 [Chloroflexota bacterium]
MRGVVLALTLLAVTAGPAFAQGSPAPSASPDLTSIPTERGLPVVVRTALHMAEVASIEEQDGVFTATADVRLRWEDARLRFPASEALGGVVDLRGDQAETRLAEIWAPRVALANLIDSPTFQTRRLRIYPDGRVELMQRTSGRFTTSFDVEKFPFDRQELAIDLIERHEPAHRLTLDFRQDDVEFSRAADGLAIEGWQPGLLHLHRQPEPSWYGESQARVRAALEITRHSAKTVASIFIPLMASLLIPLLALWLQRVENGEIKIETFELSNILIGGLFAIIALNFTISSSFPTLVTGDNTVTRLFGLNYLSLALGLLINVTVFRFNAVGRLFGKHVLMQTFRCLTWGLPTVVLSTAMAIILIAMA